MTTATTKILVIEDEGDMRLLLDLILTAENVEVAHARSLAEAEASLKEEQPTLILLDNRLPDGFGVDFIGHIKQHCPGTKIIMISGIDRAAEDVALETGADTFLSKPFTQRQLHQSIEKLLN
ncbi:MAG TPA: response regulator [Dinghuibacter sp.]|jgi:DNA-binding response OmpR family regulator|uniref:response regulator n=1 Tax=Dinghuibacter sp. TaxID=2024697 RepID=UPI002B7AB464|nr:response regulator [Dinghuibacter sp.]HTJ11844.1 response regulator [Dinghuibacter sp.]